MSDEDEDEDIDVDLVPISPILLRAEDWHAERALAGQVSTSGKPLKRKRSKQ